MRRVLLLLVTLALITITTAGPLADISNTRKIARVIKAGLVYEKR